MTNITEDLPEIPLRNPEILFLCLVVTFSVAITAYAILICKCSNKRNLYVGLHCMHVATGIAHLTLLDVYYSTNPQYPFDIILYHTTVYCNLMTPMLTACISVKMFLNVFFFKNGESIYTFIEMFACANIFVVIMQIYEEVIFIIHVYFVDMYMYLPIPAIRLTSLLLIMAITLQVLVVISGYTTASYISKSLSEIDIKLCVAYLLQLCILMLSDILLVIYTVDIWKQATENGDNKYHSNISEIYLSGRLVVEIILSLLVSLINLPVYGIVENIE